MMQVENSFQAKEEDDFESIGFELAIQRYICKFRLQYCALISQQNDHQNALTQAKLALKAAI